jgi:hypothetical protein
LSKIFASPRVNEEVIAPWIDGAKLAVRREMTEPNLTVTLRSARPLLTVVDEDLVPEAFWKSD